MRFLFGVIFGILLVAVGAAAYVMTGSYNTAATIPPGKSGTAPAGAPSSASAARLIIAHRRERAIEPCIVPSDLQ